MSKLKEEEIQALTKLLDNKRETIFFKRILAVKLVFEGYSYRAIKEMLSVSCAFITKWKKRFADGGIQALKSSHKGSEGYLTAQEKEAVIAWVIAQNVRDISELKKYLVRNYNLVFKSRESYYKILRQALRKSCQS